jgi:hypothetical protein
LPSIPIGTSHDDDKDECLIPRGGGLGGGSPDADVGDIGIGTEEKPFAVLTGDIGLNFGRITFLCCVNVKVGAVGD